MAGHRTHSRSIWAQGSCVGADRAPPIRLSNDAGAVNCRVCLYHLGLYVPLVKLREHQAMHQAYAIANSRGIVSSVDFKPFH